MAKKQSDTEIDTLKASLEVQRAKLDNAQEAAPWEVEKLQEAIANLEGKLYPAKRRDSKMKNTITMSRKRYRMRTTGTDNATYEVSVPKSWVEQEAKSVGLSVKEFFKLYRAEWFFGDTLHTVYVSFVKE